MTDHIPIQGPATIDPVKTEIPPIMVLHHDDAVTKTCVTCHRLCAGKECMAWRRETRVETSVQTLRSGLKVQGDDVVVLTGRGYCAIVYPDGVPS